MINQNWKIQQDYEIVNNEKMHRRRLLTIYGIYESETNSRST
jgi:hypothetical protein